MSQFKVSIPIKGLRDVIKEQNSELAIDRAIFHFRGSELVCTVITHSSNEEEALKEALDVIEKSLSRVCFAYNTEASVKRNGQYLTNLLDNPDIERIGRSLTVRWAYVKTDPKVTLSDLASISPKNLEPLDLALAYYRLDECGNFFYFPDVRRRKWDL